MCTKNFNCGIDGKQMRRLLYTLRPHLTLEVFFNFLKIIQVFHLYQRKFFLQILN